MSYNSFAAPASLDELAVLGPFERFGQMLEDIDIATAPVNEELDNERLDALWEWEWEHIRDELGEERCDLLCDWLEAQRAARRVALRKAEIDAAPVQVEATPEPAPASPAEDAAQPTSMADFLRKLFDLTSPEPIYVCSYHNERDEKARYAITRSIARIEPFVSDYDTAKRGLFFGVSTLQPGARTRNKATVSKTVCLHADIDFKNVDLLPADKAAAMAEVLRQLTTRLKHRPSAIVFSGGGIHAYWFLTEPMDTQAEMERIEAALRQLADLVAGDLAVCEVARVMRMPFSHNTKNGQWVEVEVLELNDQRYEFGDIEEWLSEQSPVMLRKKRELGKTVAETDDDLFARYAKEHGFKPPIDVEKRLKKVYGFGRHLDPSDADRMRCVDAQQRHAGR
jgi:hypothetical protein